MADRLPWAGPRLPPEASQQPRHVEMALDGVGEPIQGRIEVDGDGAAEIGPIEASSSGYMSANGSPTHRAPEQEVSATFSSASPPRGEHRRPRRGPHALLRRALTSDQRTTREALKPPLSHGTRRHRR